MKKALIAFAIFFACVAIVAALDVLGLPIIPEGGDLVSPVLVLVTHLPVWLYLIFSKAEAPSGIFAFCFELFARILILEIPLATVSVFNALWWMFVILWLYARERQKKHRCDYQKDGEPCEFCAFVAAQNKFREMVEKDARDVEGAVPYEEGDGDA